MGQTSPSRVGQSAQGLRTGQLPPPPTLASLDTGGRGSFPNLEGATGLAGGAHSNSGQAGPYSVAVEEVVLGVVVARLHFDDGITEGFAHGIEHDVDVERLVDHAVHQAR